MPTIIFLHLRQFNIHIDMFFYSIIWFGIHIVLLNLHLQSHEIWSFIALASFLFVIILKRLCGGKGPPHPPLFFFSKMYLNLLKIERNPGFLWLNIIINHIFFESFRKFDNFPCQYYLFSSICNMFLDFLTFPCCRETNGVSLQQMMSPVFHSKHTLNRFFNHFKNLY